MLSEIRHVDTLVGVGDYIKMEGGRHLVTSICAKRSEANPAEIVDVVLETQPPGFRSLFCLSVSSLSFSAHLAAPKLPSEDKQSGKVESYANHVQEQPSGEATPLPGQRTEGGAFFSL